MPSRNSHFHHHYSLDSGGVTDVVNSADDHFSTPPRGSQSPMASFFLRHFYRRQEMVGDGKKGGRGEEVNVRKHDEEDEQKLHEHSIHEVFGGADRNVRASMPSLLSSGIAGRERGVRLGSVDADTRFAFSEVLSTPITTAADNADERRAVPSPMDLTTVASSTIMSREDTSLLMTSADAGRGEGGRAEGDTVVASSMLNHLAFSDKLNHHSRLVSSISPSPAPLHNNSDDNAIGERGRSSSSLGQQPFSFGQTAAVGEEQQRRRQDDETDDEKRSKASSSRRSPSVDEVFEVVENRSLLVASPTTAGEKAQPSSHPHQSCGVGRLASLSPPSRARGYHSPTVSQQRGQYQHPHARGGGSGVGAGGAWADHQSSSHHPRASSSLLRLSSSSASPPRLLDALTDPYLSYTLQKASQLERQALMKEAKAEVHTAHAQTVTRGGGGGGGAAAEQRQRLYCEAMQLCVSALEGLEVAKLQYQFQQQEEAEEGGRGEVGGGRRSASVSSSHSDSNGHSNAPPATTTSAINIRQNTQRALKAIEESMANVVEHCEALKAILMCIGGRDANDSGDGDDAPFNSAMAALKCVQTRLSTAPPTPSSSTSVIPPRVNQQDESTERSSSWRNASSSLRAPSHENEEKDKGAYYRGARQHTDYTAMSSPSRDRNCNQEEDEQYHNHNHLASVYGSSSVFRGRAEEVEGPMRSASVRSTSSSRHHHNDGDGDNHTEDGADDDVDVNPLSFAQRRSDTLSFSSSLSSISPHPMQQLPQAAILLSRQASGSNSCNNQRRSTSINYQAEPSFLCDDDEFEVMSETERKRAMVKADGTTTTKHILLDHRGGGSDGHLMMHSNNTLPTASQQQQHEEQEVSARRRPLLYHDISSKHASGQGESVQAGGSMTNVNANHQLHYHHQQQQQRDEEMRRKLQRLGGSSSTTAYPHLVLEGRQRVSGGGGGECGHSQLEMLLASKGEGREWAEERARETKHVRQPPPPHHRTCFKSFAPLFSDFISGNLHHTPIPPCLREGGGGGNGNGFSLYPFRITEQFKRLYLPQEQPLHRRDQQQQEHSKVPSTTYNARRGDVMSPFEDKDAMRRACHYEEDENVGDAGHHTDDGGLSRRFKAITAADATVSKVSPPSSSFAAAAAAAEERFSKALEALDTTRTPSSLDWGSDADGGDDVFVVPSSAVGGGGDKKTHPKGGDYLLRMKERLKQQQLLREQAGGGKKVGAVIASRRSASTARTNRSTSSSSAHVNAADAAPHGAACSGARAVVQRIPSSLSSASSSVAAAGPTPTTPRRTSSSSKSRGGHGESSPPPSQRRRSNSSTNNSAIRATIPAAAAAAVLPPAASDGVAVRGTPWGGEICERSQHQLHSNTNNKGTHQQKEPSSSQRKATPSPHKHHQSAPATANPTSSSNAALARRSSTGQTARLAPPPPQLQPSLLPANAHMRAGPPPPMRGVSATAISTAPTPTLTGDDGFYEDETFERGPPTEYVGAGLRHMHTTTNAGGAAVARTHNGLWFGGSDWENAHASLPGGGAKSRGGGGVAEGKRTTSPNTTSNGHHHQQPSKVTLGTWKPSRANI